MIKHYDKKILKAGFWTSEVFLNSYFTKKKLQEIPDALTTGNKMTLNMQDIQITIELAIVIVNKSILACAGSLMALEVSNNKCRFT